MSLYRRLFKKRIVASALAASALFVACAQPPVGYYNAAEGLTGLPLRIALHNIIDNHSALSYNDLWSAFQSTDKTPANKVWDIYSDVPGGSAPYIYSFGSDQCGEYNSEGDCFNREHSFPQSWFNDGSPMVSDLFHIYPTDGWVNNKRGNLAYGDVGSADYTSQNGSKTGLCVNPGYSSTVFEPIDAYKGDLARSYFYMLTRYYGETSGWSSPMMTAGDLAPWAVNVLLAWNDLDPVSPKEVSRNNAIYALQNNRNPYIDRPEWVHQVWDASSGVAEQETGALRVWTDAHGLHVILDEVATGNTTLNVLDLAGRAVVSRSLSAKETTVPLSLAHGHYLARVSVGTNQRTVQFVW